MLLRLVELVRGVRVRGGWVWLCDGGAAGGSARGRARPTCGTAPARTTFPLADAARAHRLLEGHRVEGRVFLSPPAKQRHGDNEPGTDAESAARVRRWPSRAEHIGRFLRPQKLLDAHDKACEPTQTAILAEERERDLDALHAVEDQCIRDVVALLSARSLRWPGPLGGGSGPEAGARL